MRPSASNFVPFQEVPRGRLAEFVIEDAKD